MGVRLTGKVENVERAVDGQLVNLRAALLRHDGPLPADVALKFVRSAYTRGYADAIHAHGAEGGRCHERAVALRLQSILRARTATAVRTSRERRRP